MGVQIGAWPGDARVRSEGRIVALALLAASLLLSGCCATFGYYPGKTRGLRPVSGTLTWGGCLEQKLSNRESDGIDSVGEKIVAGFVKVLLYLPGSLLDTLTLPFVVLFDAWMKLVHASWECPWMKSTFCFFPVYFSSGGSRKLQWH